MGPKIRKKQADQIAIQGPLPPAGSPLAILGFSTLGTEKEQRQSCSGAPLRPDCTHCLPLPGHGPPSEDTMHQEPQRKLILMCVLARSR